MIITIMYFSTSLCFFSRNYEYPINEHKTSTEISFHNYIVFVYTASKYWDMKLDTYQRITFMSFSYKNSKTTEYQKCYDKSHIYYKTV